MPRFLCLPMLAAASLLASPAWAGGLAGRVLDGAGLPAAGVVVSVPQAGVEATSSAEGTYRLDGLPAGEIALVITTADGSTQRLWVRVEGEGVVLRDIFLVSAEALAGALDFLAQEEQEDEARLAESLAEAERLARDALRAPAITWIWRDTDA